MIDAAIWKKVWDDSTAKGRAQLSRALGMLLAVQSLDVLPAHVDVRHAIICLCVGRNTTIKPQTDIETTVVVELGSK